MIRLVQSLAGDKWPGAPIQKPKGEGNSAVETIGTSSHSALSSSAWNSFTGPEQILDLWDQDILSRAQAHRSVSMPAPQSNSTVPELSDRVLDLIVEKVVRRMSQDVIREIAWEVVPELSEILIKQQIREDRTAES